MSCKEYSHICAFLTRKGNDPSVANQLGLRRLPWCQMKKDQCQEHSFLSSTSCSDPSKLHWHAACNARLNQKQVCWFDISFIEMRKRPTFNMLFAVMLYRPYLKKSKISTFLLLDSMACLPAAVTAPRNQLGDFCRSYCSVQLFYEYCTQWNLQNVIKMQKMAYTNRQILTFKALFFLGRNGKFWQWGRFPSHDGLCQSRNCADEHFAICDTTWNFELHWPNHKKFENTSKFVFLSLDIFHPLDTVRSSARFRGRRRKGFAVRFHDTAASSFLQLQWKVQYFAEAHSFPNWTLLLTGTQESYSSLRSYNCICKAITNLC